MRFFFLKKNILKEACILPPRTTDNTATDSQVKKLHHGDLQE